MTAIEFDHVGKQYRLGLVGTGTLAHDLNRFWQTKVLHREDPYLKIGETNDRSTKGESDYVWALRDIDFKVEQGDVVGIIGRNGAGKSTLLKLLSRVTAPTTGIIRARGRIGSLLEVGTGFHPEMTGRENIFMNGTIMGMTTAEIKRKLDEIVDFSGCERYLDTPVKRYSSGMMVRLGFAVAAHLEPEILVVDEVLAVGDAEFQKKAIGKMQDVSRGGGRTVLFVSHNMAAVRGLCKTGVLLDKGRIAFQGTANETVDRYLETNKFDKVKTCILTPKHRPWKDEFKRLIEVLEVSILNETTELATDEPLELLLRLRKSDKCDIPNCQYTISIYDESGTRVMDYCTDPIRVPSKGRDFSVKLKLKNHDLFKGNYAVRILTGLRDFSSGILIYDATSETVSFEIRYLHYALKDEYGVDSKRYKSIYHYGNLIESELLESEC